MHMPASWRRCARSPYADPVSIQLLHRRLLKIARFITILRLRKATPKYLPMNTKPASTTANEGLIPGADEAKAQTSINGKANSVAPAKEYGGPKGPEPTRYGDWERNGKCVDF